MEDNIGDMEFGKFEEQTTKKKYSVRSKLTYGSNTAIINSSGQLHTVLRGFVDSGNSTTTPLPGDTGGSDHIFTGEPIDTLDYAAVTVLVYSDVASAIEGLKVEYSNDGTTWHSGSEEPYTVLAGATKFFTPTLQDQYMRVVYTNGASAQTSFFIYTTLRKTTIKWSSHNIDDPIKGEDDAQLVKAVLTGEDPDGIFANAKLDKNGSQRIGLRDGETGRRAEVEPLGALKTIIPKRLVGTTFANGTKDTNFWTETVTGTGSVTQAGEIILSTGTTANSTSKYETNRKARKVTGTTNQFRAVARNVEVPTADCIRRIGPYSSTDGFFLQFNGETFQLGSRKNSVDILVSNGSFNGNAGATIDFGGGTDFTRIVVDYTALSAKFFLDGTLIHTISASTTSLTNSLNLPVTMEVINENGNTTNNSYEILFATILRLGELETNPIYKYINTNTTTVCKYNAGKLQRLIINDNVGDITIYDGTSTGGDLISELDTSQGSEPAYTVEYNIPFSNGLTIVTAGGVEVTVVYE